MKHNLMGKEKIENLGYTAANSYENEESRKRDLFRKLVEIDKKTGKYRLSRKALLPKPEGFVEREPRPDRGPRENRGPRRDNQGPRRD